MPIYEYECSKCGVIEVMQGINDKPLKKCPECKTRKVKKLISESSFHLKGSGWYVTDYAGKNGGSKPAECASGNGNGNGNGNGADKAEKKEPETKKTEPAKTEAKPAADKPKGSDRASAN